MAENQAVDRLNFTIFLALALHALLIFGVTFQISKSNRVAPTLNITLATHAAKNKPEKADFLAQNDQEASGTESDVKELTTTETADVSNTKIQEVNPITQQETQIEQKHNAKIIHTADSQRLTNSSTNADKKPVTEAQKSNNDQTASFANKLASLQAKLDQQRQTLAREPRITRHTSVSAKSSVEAAYYNYWSDKILRIGNQNFPEEALRKKIFGSLRLEVGIRADGRVQSVKITDSSGHSLLDEAARKIVRLAEPFKPLPPEIAKTTDILVIYRTWNFEITGQITTD